MDNWGWNLTLLVGIIILELFSNFVGNFLPIPWDSSQRMRFPTAHFPPNIQDGAFCLKPIPYQWGQNYHYIPEKNMGFLAGPQWNPHVNLHWPILGPPEFPPKEWRWRPRAFGTSYELHLDKLSLAAERVLGVKKTEGKKRFPCDLPMCLSLRCFFFFPNA